MSKITIPEFLNGGIAILPGNEENLDKLLDVLARYGVEWRNGADADDAECVASVKEDLRDGEGCPLTYGIAGGGLSYSASAQDYKSVGLNVVEFGDVQFSEDEANGEGDLFCEYPAPKEVGVLELLNWISEHSDDEEDADEEEDSEDDEDDDVPKGAALEGEYTLDDIAKDGNIAVVMSGEESYKRFLDVAQEKGWKWRGGCDAASPGKLAELDSEDYVAITFSNWHPIWGRDSDEKPVLSYWGSPASDVYESGFNTILESQVKY